ncbi:SGNH/GDSL hydrolase family protein [Terasakiella sp.]|uniref:SGNH/GDSL hydrolase family protein n=1 Tax=Terasakiella sp. TaxID=2034861 RepID=UPI003AA9DD21
MISRKYKLAIISFGILIIPTFFIIEIFLRLLFPLSYFANFTWFLPKYNVAYYEEQFIEQYYGKELNAIRYDETLGWDYHKENNGIRPPADPNLDKSQNKLRMIVIGDSFAYGSEVDDDKHFTHLVNQKLQNIEAFTMGTPGYGLGQAALKYLQMGSQYQPDIVIFAVHPADYIRTGLRLFNVPKPLFINDPTTQLGYRVDNVPVPLPADELQKVEDKIFWQSRLEYFLVAAFTYLPPISDYFANKYISEMDKNVTKALEIVKSEVESRGGKFIILEIDEGEYFTPKSKNPFAAYHNSLEKIYNKLDSSWINLSAIWSSNFSISTIQNELYINRTDGTYGHLTEKGNVLVAEEIIKRLCKFPNIKNNRLEC